MYHKQKVLVIGASGVLGQLVCREISYLLGEHIDLYIGDYREERGKITARDYKGTYCFVDRGDEASIEKAIRGMSLVVIALNQSEPIIQRLCLQQGIKSVDVTVQYDFIVEVQKLHEQFLGSGVGTLMMSGFFPGLSGLMVKEIINGLDKVETVDVSLIQNTNAHVGVTGIIDMLEIIGSQVEDTSEEENTLLPGFKKKRKLEWVNNPLHHEVRLIQHTEKKILEKRLDIKTINYWTCWNNKVFNQMIAGVLKLGLMRLLISEKGKKLLNQCMKHKPEKGEETYLIVEAKGYQKEQLCQQRCILKAFSDYETTAKVTSALVRIMLEKEILGVKFPFEITTLQEVLEIMNEPRIEVTTYGYRK